MDALKKSWSFASKKRSSWGVQTIGLIASMFFNKLKLGQASFRGARSLICIVSWSMIRNLHKSCGASNWDRTTQKNYGAQSPFYWSFKVEPLRTTTF